LPSLSSKGGSAATPATTAPKTANPTQKTVYSDQRIGNDRYLVYTDGTSQRIPNYYTPAVNLSATTPPAGSSAASSMVSTTANALGSVLGVLGRPGQSTGLAKATGLPTSLNPALGVSTSATPITGRTQQPIANSASGLPVLAANANILTKNPPSLGLLIVVGVGLYLALAA